MIKRFRVFHTPTGIRAWLRASMAEGSRQTVPVDDRSLDALWTTQMNISKLLKIRAILLQGNATSNGWWQRLQLIIAGFC
ncbi:hypothetical protein KFK09_009179 [Dendrobium nobile]|uniref:Uncharacterized protein n=1 Tax=Dendrobium nobile TaxID=94219 RepID=A0A8T3BSU3_DENNO|nr:hypothetical protein KFK09_009179 [Dendrobium nobile]